MELISGLMKMPFHALLRSLAEWITPIARLAKIVSSAFGSIVIGMALLLVIATIAALRAGTEGTGA